MSFNFCIYFAERLKIVHSVETCTHTMEPESCPRSDGAAWWRLEFPTEVQIDWVIIWNRIGGKSKRIDRVKVRREFWNMKLI